MTAETIAPDCLRRDAHTRMKFIAHELHVLARELTKENQGGADIVTDLAMEATKALGQLSYHKAMAARSVSEKGQHENSKDI
jgi:hypothetical protein